MSKEKKTLSIRDLMLEKGFDPAEDMIELAQNLKEDKEYIRSQIEEIGNSSMKAQMLVESVGIDKTRLATLKALSDAKQREDDQRIKLAQGGDNSGLIVEYSVPKYEKKLLPNGKYKMIKVDDVETETENS